MQLDINDINIATKALRLAQSRGSFEMEESAQLTNTVLRLEGFFKAHQEQMKQNEAAEQQASESGDKVEAVTEE